MKNEKGHSEALMSWGAALKFIGYFALVFVISSIGALGQTTTQAMWRGALRNAGGAPIADAKVTLSSSGAKAEARTDSNGRFQLQLLPAGSYHLTVATQGSTVQYAQPIDLRADSPLALLTLSGRGELTVATLEEKNQTGTGGEELSSQAVSELPLNKRDFSTLLLLAAGTMTDTNGATNFTAQFAINGQRGVEATFAMDGADISDPEMGGATFSNFNVDAVESIDSSSGWMPAEIGRGASGFTNIHTRSGASGFMDRFSSLCATRRSTRATTLTIATPAYPGRIPPFRRNEFGFTNGGPVLHSARV